MSERDDRVRLQHILDAINRIRRHVAGINREAFLADEKTQDAVIRQFEIIGEACKQLHPETRASHSAVPWPKIAGMRDVLIHEYFGVDPEIVWDTVEYGLADLETAVSSILREEKGGNN